MQGDVHHVALARDGAGKAQLIEHAQRPPIVRQGMRVKVADTGIAGDECQMTQHRWGDAFVLISVADDKGDVGLPRWPDVISGASDDFAMKVGQ
jgi:hypothetical protein